MAGGWAGTVDQRIDRDVLPSKPTVLTVMLGMNDGGYKPFDAMGLARYKDGMEHILTRVSAAHPTARVTVLRPGAFDDVSRPKAFPGGYDDVLRRHGCVAEGLGRARGATIVDMRTALNGALAKLVASSPDLAPHLIPDRIHPSRAGHYVMGAALLRAWRAPEIVTSVEIDAAAATVGATVRTSVTDLRRTAGTLRWSQADRALPLPLKPGDADVALAERAGARLLDLHRQMLKVTGLADGRYTIRIDSRSIATVTAANLATGVNLSAYENPMVDRAVPALWLIPEPHEITKLCRRLLVAGPTDPRIVDAVAVLHERRLADIRSAHEQLKPGTHAYEIVATE